MVINYFFVSLNSFLIASLFIFLLKKLSLKYNLLVSKGKPLIGGVGMGLSFILVSLSSFLVYRYPSKELIGIAISSFAMLVFGIVDDWQELSIWAKFLVQVIATSFLIFFGIRTQIVDIGNLLNIIITFTWVLGITNAFNHLDVMDGVASGAAIIVSFAFFVISILNGDIRTAILSLAFAGVVSGFFLYNFPPARVYMGNSGSHFLGFVLAAIALILSYAPLERKVALFSPLIILGLPIFDTAFLILIRIIKKNLPFKKSNDHLVLRFFALGYSKKKTLFIMLALCLFFCLSAITVSQVSNARGIAIIFFVIFVSLIIAVRMSRVVIDE